MIPKHEMLDVASRAMHNPRAAWFTVRPLSEKPMPYPFRMDSEAVPAIVAQFAVEHPTDMDARRVISIATTEYGYSVWCGDKFSQGDVTALDASLRVAMAVSDLPLAYVEGARAAMMSLYGSYPLRAPCHFWKAWHNDQGVCKHVAAALQYIERTHPEGLAGLLDELDDMLNSLTTSPLADLLAPVAKVAPRQAPAEGAAVKPPAGSPQVPNSLASMQSLAGLLKAADFPHILIRELRRPVPGATATSQAQSASAGARATPGEHATPNKSAASTASAGEGERWSDAAQSLLSTIMGNPAIKHLFALRDGFPQASAPAAKPAQPDAPKAAPAQAPRGTEENAKRLAAVSLARLKRLVPNITPELEQTLVSMAGTEDKWGNFVVWPIVRIAATNEHLSAQPERKELAKMLFIADTQREDGMFALNIDADGVLRRPEVYRWDQKANKVEWYAEDLAIYVRRRASEG